MPRDKDRKRIIRNRMKKTGESYTTARAHVISKTKVKQPTARGVDHAALAGMSDDKIAAKTGRSWKEWVRALDADEAAAMPHRDIAALVHKKHRVGDWWAQTVTVGYERIKFVVTLVPRDQPLPTVSGSPYRVLYNRIPVDYRLRLTVEDSAWISSFSAHLDRGRGPRPTTCSASSR